MGNHRMFSLAVVDTDQFNDMPMSARLLYYELGMRTDDDGFVASPKKIVKMIGCTEDDLKLLIAKGFVICFDSGIIAITHWNINNKIRKDRKKDTIFFEEMRSLSINENGAYTTRSETKCQPTDNQMSAQDKLSKVKISKDKLSKDISLLSADADGQESFDFQFVTDAFNSLCPSLPKVKTMSEKRRRRIRNAQRLLGEMSFEELFAKVEQSDFLTGRSGPWSCGFDWIMEPSNLTKIIEGNDDNTQTAVQPRNYDEVF